MLTFNLICSEVQFIKCSVERKTNLIRTTLDHESRWTNDHSCTLGTNAWEKTKADPKETFLASFFYSIGHSTINLKYFFSNFTMLS